MSPKASDLAARFASSAAGTRSLPATLQGRKEPSQEHAGKPAPSIVRIMVKMPKAQHRFIRQFALNSDSDVSTIVRTLLRRIENDPVFAEEVRSLLREPR